MKICEIVFESEEDNRRELERARAMIQRDRESQMSVWNRLVKKKFPKWLSPNYRPNPEDPTGTPIPPPVSDKLEHPDVAQARVKAFSTTLDKMKLLDRAIKMADRNGLLNPGLRFDSDISSYIKDAEKDNYKSLNDRLDRALHALQKRLSLYKTAYRKFE